MLFGDGCVSVNWVISADEAVAPIESGATIGLGGFLSMRHPMALVRALLRRKLKDLTVVAPAGGIDIDLLIASGAVHKAVIGVCSLDLAGPAPAFRKAAEDRSIDVVDIGVSSLYRALEAGWRDLPEMPASYTLADEMLAHHPGRRDPEHPALIRIPAIRPDFALIHADRASRRGDVRLSAPALDVPLAWASKKVVVSVERIIDEGDLAHWGATGISRDHVDVLVPAPFGAHPTSCPPDHAPDFEAIVDYREAAEKGSVAAIPADEESYRKNVGVARLIELRRLASRGGLAAWNLPQTR